MLCSPGRVNVRSDSVNRLDWGKAAGFLRLFGAFPPLSPVSIGNDRGTYTLSAMLLFRTPIPADWLPKVCANLPAVLVDHAHLERKAATSALNLEKFRLLHGQVRELNAIAREELDHFDLVLGILTRRGIPFSEPRPSAWIKGLMRAIRPGVQAQVIDHLIACSLIEGRSCEKFQVLAEGLLGVDPELSEFYRSLVESEGNHYAAYLIMARHIDETETDRRLEEFLELEAKLTLQGNPFPMLH
jgi:tRNA 2-(methylsulfanyl)-N6-isopentenyladenosine37 hydroxylase